MEFEYYLKNPEKINIDVVMSAKQSKYSYIADILVSRYHKYLEKAREIDKKASKT